MTAPEADSQPTTYPAVEAVTYYQARCTTCGTRAEYDEFTAFGDAGTAIERATEECEWWSQDTELLCRDCQKCEVCQAPRAYDIGDHLVCVDHEDHEFRTVQ